MTHKVAIVGMGRWGARSRARAVAGMGGGGPSRLRGDKRGHHTRRAEWRRRRGGVYGSTRGSAERSGDRRRRMSCCRWNHRLVRRASVHTRGSCVSWRRLAQRHKLFTRRQHLRADRGSRSSAPRSGAGCRAGADRRDASCGKLDAPSGTTSTLRKTASAAWARDWRDSITGIRRDPSQARTSSYSMRR